MLVCKSRKQTFGILCWYVKVESKRFEYYVGK